MDTSGVISKSFLLGGLVLGMAAPYAGVQAANFQVLHAFQGATGDGASPFGALLKGSASRYGATYYGGSNDLGTIFKLERDGTTSVLHSFAGGADGANPQTGLVIDASGNLYGTTSAGGASNCGTVFKMKPSGKVTVLYAFQCGIDGFTPSGGVVMDADGNLYGTVYGGGAANRGAVFKLTPDGTESVVHSFTGGVDGAYPVGGVIADKKGNFYGTTYGGGDADLGTVFKLRPNRKETVLYSFKGGTDGATPFSGLVTDSSKNLYGTTWGGGGNGCNGNGCGTVFRIAQDGTETVLHSFAGGNDGFGLYGGVAVDKGSNVYGSTSYGGGSGCSGNGCGIVFKIAADGTKTDLHAFSGDDGARPSADLTADKKGSLYGTTFDGGGSGCGGSGCGVAFKIKQ